MPGAKMRRGCLHLVLEDLTYGLEGMENGFGRRKGLRAGVVAAPYQLLGW